MATYFDVILFSLVGGLFSLIGGVILLSKEKLATNLANYATPFAAGALLAAVFFDLLPEGIKADTNPQTVLTWTLVGIVIFFFLERFLTWFHHHHEHKDAQNQSHKSLIIIGDTIHNALDGVVIATAFIISVPVGIVTTIAVALHEIPQEVGDFGLLLSKGMNRIKVLWVNISSALATTIFAVITFAMGSTDKLPISAMLGISAGFLLYIASSDIIPSIHEHTPKNKLFDIRPILLLIGIVIVGFAIMISKKYGA